eukprot:m.122171 g.122171  ORF g.122171 m.122171 type:complete len:163 (-) comp9309_c4_seq1:73-561(-)
MTEQELNESFLQHRLLPQAADMAFQPPAQAPKDKRPAARREPQSGLMYSSALGAQPTKPLPPPPFKAPIPVPAATPLVSAVSAPTKGFSSTASAANGDRPKAATNGDRPKVASSAANGDRPKAAADASSAVSGPGPGSLLGVAEKGLLRPDGHNVPKVPVPS